MRSRFRPRGRSGGFRGAAAQNQSGGATGRLFYLAADGRLMAVEVKAGTVFQVGLPEPLFETGITDAVM